MQLSVSSVSSGRWADGLLMLALAAGLRDIGLSPEPKYILFKTVRRKNHAPEQPGSAGHS